MANPPAGQSSAPPDSRPTTQPTLHPADPGTAASLPQGYVVERVIGAPGSGPGELDTPMGLAIDGGGRLFVADTGNSRVQVFDDEGDFLSSVGTSWDGPALQRPMDIAVGTDESLFVADFSEDAVFRFLPDGVLVERLGEGLLDTPAGIARIDRDRIAVTEFYGHRIRILDGGGQVTIGSEGHAPGQLYYPTDLAAMGDDLIVADAYNHRVQRLRSDGSPVAEWRGPPARPFEVPTGVAVTEQAIHVADSGNRRVVALRLTGEPFAEWQLSDDQNQAVSSPVRLAAWRDAIYVADPANHRIVVLRLLTADAVSD